MHGSLHLSAIENSHSIPSHHINHVWNDGIHQRHATDATMIIIINHTNNNNNNKIYKHNEFTFYLHAIYDCVGV